MFHVSTRWGLVASSVMASPGHLLTCPPHHHLATCPPHHHLATCPPGHLVTRQDAEHERGEPAAEDPPPGQRRGAHRVDGALEGLQERCKLKYLHKYLFFYFLNFTCPGILPTEFCDVLIVIYPLKNNLYRIQVTTPSETPTDFCKFVTIFLGICICLHSP